MKKDKALSHPLTEQTGRITRLTRVFIRFKGQIVSFVMQQPIFFSLDTLREAIDVAATGVGRDWDKMYLTLPFNPPRTPGTRSHDLEGTQTSTFLSIERDFRFHEKICLRGLRPGPTQTRLYNHIRWQNA